MDLLARAFRDNPLNVAVIGSADAGWRERCNALGMRSLLPVAQQGGNVLAAREGDELVAALVSAPPFGYPLPAPPLMARLRCLAGQGWRVAGRWARVFRRLEALHPPEPCWYLGTLGVDPTRQGHGFGRGLLRHWLTRVDADGCPAYLETDRASNVPFYAAEGFEVRGETRLLGAPVWRLLRPAGR